MSKIYAPRDKNVLEQRTKFTITEAYRTLRTNLLFTLDNSKCNKILVCSALPLDGKTTTSVNLAITLAKGGSRVIIIDADLRKGRIHSFFNQKRDNGFSNAIAGQVALEDVIIKTAYENLSCITSGTTPPNPAELLASVQTEEIFKKLEESFDYIIIDSAPVNVVSDSLPLTRIVDGVLFVVRQEKTRHKDLDEAIEKLEFVNAKILGFVLNGDKDCSQYYNSYSYSQKNIKSEQ